MTNVFIVSSGSGADGDEWTVHGIFSSYQLAKKYIESHGLGESVTIEQWIVDQDGPDV